MRIHGIVKHIKSTMVTSVAFWKCELIDKHLVVHYLYPKRLE